MPRYEIIDLGTLGGDDSSADCTSNNGGIVGYSENSLFHERAVSFDPTVKSNITNLGTLGVRYSYARAINNVGQVAGWSDTADGLSSHAYLWDPINGMVDLGALPGMECNCASALNDFGVVVGSSGHCDDDNAFIWDRINGMHYLEEGPSGDNAAVGINNAGQVIGYVWRSDLHDVSAFLWNSDSGVVELGTLGGRASCAIAINNAGQVVGWADTPSMAEHAFIWDSINGMRDLGTLGGTDNSWALDISDNGHVVGCSEPRSDDAHAFIWDSGTGMIDLGPGYACAINDAGQIVGYGSRSAPGFYSPAFYWDIVNGRISLIDLLPSGSGWQELIRALDINNRGQIVGMGITDAGQYHAFLMTPVPSKIIYVDDDAPGSNNGSSWEDAYNYLQDALASAWSGDEIRVAQGIYTPDSNSTDPNGSGDRTATFQLINGVTLKGGYAGFGEPDPNARDINLYETILSGDLDGNDVEVNDPCDLENEPTRAENSYHIVIASETDETAVLDGITITGGNANGPWPTNRGGGIYSYSSSPTIMNCTISGNSSGMNGGGGINNHGIGMHHHLNCNPTIINCTISRNYGGGIKSSGSPTLINSQINGNNGCGMINGLGNPTLINCTISGNNAGGWDSCDSYSTLINCMFVGNSSDWNARCMVQCG